MLKLTIIGALGRMGRKITEISLSDPEIEIVGLIESPFHKDINKKIYPTLPEVLPDLTKVIFNTDVVIDFSTPQATQEVVFVCKNNKKPIVIGTTGHTQQQITEICSAAKIIPIVLSPNMSVGMNIFFKLIESIVKLAKKINYDIEIIETHHRNKKDAPSGTAKKIMEIIKNFLPETKFVFSREGENIKRSNTEVGVFSIRAGDIVGEHKVLFVTEGEKIELTHTAFSRDIFAIGALSAAKWVVDKPPGLYNMYDVIGID